MELSLFSLYTELVFQKLMENQSDMLEMFSEVLREGEDAIKVDKD